MSVEKREGKHLRPWQVKYRDGQNIRRSKQFKLRKDAEVFNTRVGNELLDGTHVADSASTTVEKAGAKWIVSCKAAGLEAGTLEQYQIHLHKHIIPFIGRIKLNQLSIPRLRAFTDQLQEEGRSLGMVRKVRSSLGNLLADAQEQGLIVHNVVRQMKRNKRADTTKRQKLEVGRDIPAPLEIRAFINALAGHWRPILLTPIFTGIRSSELRALRWQDIDLENRMLHVRQRVDRYGKIGPPKSAAGTRSIPLAPIMLNTLREWRLACPRCEMDLVFPSATGKPRSHGSLIKDGLKPAMKRAGLGYTGIHSLRHFFASWCINRIVDGGLELPAKTVQVRLGHGTISMTLDTYGHLFPQADDAAALAAGERALLG